jgi:hypothetical protein
MRSRVPVQSVPDSVVGCVLRLQMVHQFVSILYNALGLSLGGGVFRCSWHLGVCSMSVRISVSEIAISELRPFLVFAKRLRCLCHVGVQIVRAIEFGVVSRCPFVLYLLSRFLSPIVLPAVDFLYTPRLIKGGYGI